MCVTTTLLTYGFGVDSPPLISSITCRLVSSSRVRLHSLIGSPRDLVRLLKEGSPENAASVSISSRNGGYFERGSAAVGNIQLYVRKNSGASHPEPCLTRTLTPSVLPLRPESDGTGGSRSINGSLIHVHMCCCAQRVAMPACQCCCAVRCYLEKQEACSPDSRPDGPDCAASSRVTGLRQELSLRQCARDSYSLHWMAPSLKRGTASGDKRSDVVEGNRLELLRGRDGTS